jgi:hypothetical protein
MRASTSTGAGLALALDEADAAVTCEAWFAIVRKTR